jgi:stage II sporulation protein D
MRRMVLAFTGLVLALAASAPAGSRAPAPVKPAPVTATTFVASGRGWGHGVGMSQYGALGFANEGWTYDQILGHYYVGAQLGPAPVARVRVLVAEARAALKLRSQAPFRVRDVFGKTYPLPAGEVALGPELRVTVNGTPTVLTGPIVFVPVNAVGLEQYLAGVVAQEMPSSWPEEALKAQAVAARSYALSRRLTGKGFDLYADVRSQVYGGIPGEHARTTAAVGATKGEVLLFDGKPIDALFHSTSGGATIDAAEGFGKAVPYLVAVDDPYSTLSPVHRWGPVAVSEATIRKGLKLRSPLTGLRLTRGPSGRVTSVEVRSALGSATVTGAALRSATGLRSTWITQLATLSLTRPGGPAVYGKMLTLQGKANGIPGALLEQRVDGVWTRLAGPGAAPAAKVRLLAPTTVRISAGTLAGPTMKVPVAPLVTLRADGPAGLSGRVRPLEPGTTVELQVERAPDDWLTIGETTSGLDGAFSLAPAEPGTYRARVAPVQGFAEGFSARIELR